MSPFNQLPLFNQFSRMRSRLNRQPNASRAQDQLLPSQIECLESRMMLAGDVTFSVSGDNLTVNGSGADDCVEIENIEGEITVNGESTGISENDLNNLTIKTLGGDDEVVIGGREFGSVEIGGNLKIITKAGEDYVRIYDTQVSGKTTIKTGNDNDTVNTYDARYGGKVKVVTGSGNDRVCVAVNQLMDGSVGLNKLDGYALNLDVSFKSKVKVNLGSGSDRLNLGNVSMGEPLDRAISYDGFVSFSQGASANGGSGEDFLRIGGYLVDPDSLPSDASVQVKKFESPALVE